MFRSKNMIVPNLHRTVDTMNRNVEKSINQISSSLPENMDISPSMVLSPSPAKTDWLRQFACGTNKPAFF